MLTQSGSELLCLSSSASVTCVAVIRNASLVLNDILDVLNCRFEVHALDCSDSLIGVLVVNSDRIASGLNSYRVAC